MRTNDLLEKERRERVRLADQTAWLRSLIQREMPAGATESGVAALNRVLLRRSGIEQFFADPASVDAFIAVAGELSAPSVTSSPRERGDVQTPADLAGEICNALAALGVDPTVVLEPTCGSGAFLGAALERFPRVRRMIGIEIESRYLWEARLRLLAVTEHQRPPRASIQLCHDDVFSYPFEIETTPGDEILVIGNPPWITNTELARLGASRPARANSERVRGIEALTGRSNFDLGEVVINRMLDAFSGHTGWLAMLCKIGVIRRILDRLPLRDWPVADFRMIEIDAQRRFGAAVGAGLLVMRLGQGVPASERHGDLSIGTCHVSTLDQPGVAHRVFGRIGGRFVADVDLYRPVVHLDGRSPFVWRQGIKHDCADVMELRLVDGTLTNGLQQPVNVEDAWLYPLAKSSDLGEICVRKVRRMLVVPQTKIGQSTDGLRTQAPQLWAYLNEHADVFARRRSSIYRTAPRFGLFGVGEYTFMPYKVAIAGLLKQPRFSLIEPIDGKPVVLDDTCYFIGFEQRSDALFTVALLNHPMVARLLQAITFSDAKRPYTKAVLMRIDLAALARVVTEEQIGLVTDAERREYQAYVRRLSEGDGTGSVGDGG